MSPDEIRVVYAQGEEAVITLATILLILPLSMCWSNGQRNSGLFTVFCTDTIRQAG